MLVWALPFLVITFFSTIALMISMATYTVLDKDDLKDFLKYYVLILVAGYCIFTFVMILRGLN